MLSLAGIRYRNVLIEHGGPIERLEAGSLPVRGRQMIHAHASLKEGLIPMRLLSLYRAGGAAIHPVATIARHKAVSEALERWAYERLVRSDRAPDFAFDVDPSSVGMSTFPGLLRRQARRSAVIEAIERYSLIAWWEGLANAQPFDTDWPGVSAVAIDGPFGGITVVAYAQTPWGGYVYGHAAEESCGAACERAVMELARHEWVLRHRWLSLAAGERVPPTNIFEQRVLFFATEEGHELFQERVAHRTSARMPKPEILCDRDIPGPWDQYATVWRFALRPLSDGYLRGGERYFFL